MRPIRVVGGTCGGLTGASFLPMRHLSGSPGGARPRAGEHQNTVQQSALCGMKDLAAPGIPASPSAVTVHWSRCEQERGPTSARTCDPTHHLSVAACPMTGAPGPSGLPRLVHRHPRFVCRRSDPHGASSAPVLLFSHPPCLTQAVTDFSSAPMLSRGLRDSLSQDKCVSGCCHAQGSTDLMQKA